MTIPIFPYSSTGSLHRGTHATLGDMMAKALWECDSKKCMGLLHEIPRDEGGKVDFAWSEPVSSASWGMLPCESSLICDPLSGSFPVRKVIE